MAVTTTEVDGVTVHTLTFDPQSPCPPICQIIGSLCIRPWCGEVSPHLRTIQGTYLSKLATVQIMIGLLTIGLGAIVFSTYYFCMPPFWMGGLYILFGAMNITSEIHPSVCMVTINSFLNLCGVAFTITAVIMHSINLFSMFMWDMCSGSYNKMCLEEQTLTQKLLGGIHAVLIVLSLAELTIVLFCAMLGIKALDEKEKKEKEIPEDPECLSPLLEEIKCNPGA